MIRTYRVGVSLALQLSQQIILPVSEQIFADSTFRRGSILFSFVLSASLQIPADHSRSICLCFKRIYADSCLS